MKKKVVYGVAIASLAIIAFFAYKRITKPKVFLDVVASKPVIEIVKPSKVDIHEYTNLTGKIISGEEVSVFAKASGEVKEVTVKIGDKVEVGDVICTIDVEKTLEQLKTALDSADLGLTQAKTNLERQEALYNSGNLSEQAYESSIDAVKAAQLQYDSAKKNYDNMLEYSVVTSPIDGIISECNVSVHGMASQQSPICVVSNEDSKEVAFNTTKKIRDYIDLGQHIDLIKGSISYKADIIEIGTKVESSGMFRIKAKLDDAVKTDFAPGETVKIKIESASAKGVMIIPIDSVYFDNGESFVYTYSAGALHKIKIETGLSNKDSIEVKSGLDAGEDILATWTSELGDGTEVDIK